jgi:hypothetical protein
MAAIIINKKLRAKKQGSVEENIHDGPSSSYPIPVHFEDAPDKELFALNLEKSMLNSLGILQWGPRRAVISQSFLTFYDVDDPEMCTELDRIPFIEVISISSKYLEQLDLDGADLEKHIADKVQTDAGRRELTMLIRTIPGGTNCGRNYTLCCEDGCEFVDCLARLLQAVDEAKEWQTEREIVAEVGGSFFHQFRYKTDRWYESDGPQAFVGVLIVASFAVDCAEAQILPEVLAPESEDLFFALRHPSLPPPPHH